MLAASAASIGSAACYAVCAVLQHREAGRVEAGGVALLWRLLHRPAFLAAGVVEVAGLALQAVALTLGAVSLVQVLLVSGLLFAVPLAALVEHRRATATEAVGAVLCVLGLAAFLVAGRPEEGVAEVPLTRALAVGAPILAGAGALVLLALRAGRLRASLLGAAAGLCYGVSTGAFKLSADGFAQHGLLVLEGWPPYLLVAAGGTGLVLTQNAFRDSGLGLPLAVLTLAEPVAAVLWGSLVLHEHLASSPAARLGQVVAALVAAVGVGLLSTTPAARYKEPAAPFHGEPAGDRAA